jgi:Na+/melibiose symporter-like transporter
MAEREQDISNHTQWRWMFHFTALPILIINAVVWIVTFVKAPSMTSGWMAVVWVSIAMYVIDTRFSILTVQDRLIRQEMRIRLERVLGASAKEKIAKLSCSQLVALRFASDAELPALVDRTMTGEFKAKKEIKQQIRDWQADWLRA